MPSPEEDARINAGMDDESPELGDEFFKNAKPAAEVLGADVVMALVAKRKRGRPAGAVADQKKEQVSIRLSQDVLEHFKAGGAGWQTRIDAVLREWVTTHH